MSSREPLWFCHECRAEMRPMMMPDPHCASCNGTFVEKMEDPSDDPRSFQEHDPNAPEFDPFSFGTLLSAVPPLRLLGDPTRPRNPNGQATGPGLRFEIRSNGNGTTRTFTLGGPNTLENTPTGGVPTMNEFLGRAGSREDGIAAQLMMQYVMAMLSGRGVDPSQGQFSMGFGDPETPGRMGDYVFNQEALDQIMTSLMENANASRPVPASENVIADLPREVLEIGAPMLEKDCAVCKDQFKVDTEDPDEQVVVTLPCKHAFHEGCIVPWLKSSGTCPVCRHALVPQPNQHPQAPTPGTSTTPAPEVPSNRPRSSSVPRRRATSPGNERGLFGSLFGGGGSRQNNDGRTRHNRSNDRDPPLPGGWGEQVD